MRTVSSAGFDGTDQFGDCVHPPVEANCTDGWCEIPAGCFVMGSPESEWGHAPYEEIQVAVTLTRSFIIQQTEVTIEQWMTAGLPPPAAVATCVEPGCPVASVNWFDALAYANVLSERHDPPLAPCYQMTDCQGEIGRGDYICPTEIAGVAVYDCEGFRLPTDAEWEYAARAGTSTAYYSGDNTAYGDQVRCSAYCNPDPNLEAIGWYCRNSGDRAHPVKQLPPNAWGLYDMSGNIAEWNNDESDGYGALTGVDPGGAIGWGTRNLRGGSFGLSARSCRVAAQSERGWDYRSTSIGLRLVRTLR